MLVLHLGGIRGVVRWPRPEYVLGHVPVGARKREAFRRAEREAATMEQIPKASIMGGMRRCLVFTGSIDAVLDLTIGHQSLTPNWWWPDDRAWIVVSELDAPSTYVGGSAALAQAILDEPQLEVVPCHPDHRFDWLGDRINASG